MSVLKCGFMSLTSLPFEVLEKILLYLDIKDLSTLVETFDIEVNDYFWKKICNREDYQGMPDKEPNWKTIFQRNYNWRFCNFVMRVNEFYPIEVNEVPGNDRKYFLHGNNLLVSTDNCFHVWNIEKAPELVQTLPYQLLTSSGSNLLTKDSSSISIYSFCDQTYKEVAKIAYPRNLFGTDYCLTNDFFAVFNNQKNSVKIVNFTNFEVYDFNTNKPGFTVIIFGDILYILGNRDSRYLLTRFNMANKRLLDDLTLFTGAYMISLPEINISESLITGSVQNLETLETFIKIWNTDGELLKSLPSSWIGNGILWMILEGDYLIFSNSNPKIIIWHSLKPDLYQEIKKGRDFSIHQKTISSSLLILSSDYNHCFCVFDYKKATLLYEVHLEKDFVFNGISYLVSTSKSFANDHFYVALKKCCVVDNATGECSYGSTSLVPPSFTKKCFIFVHDFRGQADPS